MSYGASLIEAERKRQVASEGWNDSHDDAYQRNELVMAAICYLVPNWMMNFWPWGEGYWKPTPKDRIRELTKAGALIAAEIDRLNRKSKANDSTTSI